MADRHLPARESEGSRALKRCGKTRSELRTICGVKPREISRWISGARRPGPERRLALAHHLGIPVEAWDRDPAEDAGEAGAAPRAASSPPQPTAATTTTTAATQAAQLRGLIDHQLGELQSSNASAEQSAKIISSLSQSIRNLGSLTGEATGITQAKILKSPAWKRIEAALVEALEPHPDALEDTLIAIKGLSTEQLPPRGPQSG